MAAPSVLEVQFLQVTEVIRRALSAIGTRLIDDIEQAQAAANAFMLSKESLGV
jgi:hypothetical protein